LKARDIPFLVIETEDSIARKLTTDGVEVIVGSGVLAAVLTAANITGARVLIVAIPDGFEAGALVMRARELNPRIRIVARAHSDAEVEHLAMHGADRIIMGEREIAQGMLDYVFDEGAADAAGSDPKAGSS
jgi:CPA2 family monovalent cation:H+ antiporter-2